MPSTEIFHERRAQPVHEGAVAAELLRLLARQGRRVPYPVGLTAVVIAVMAASDTPEPVGMLAGLWVVVVLAVLGLRWWLLGRLPDMHELPQRRQLRWAIALSALNGAVFSASLAFAPYLNDYERMVQTILLLGLCAGAVATTAGFLPVLLVFLLPVSLANALAWLVGSGAGHEITGIDWTLAALILGFALILAGLARDGFAVFVESVRIRQQQITSNQQLRHALAQTESAMQAKTRFLAAASHDLRQPMHTLSLLGAALLHRPLDAQSANIGRRMNVALQSLATQMDALLDISKLDADVVPVNARVFSLDRWIEPLCLEMQAAAQGKGLAMSLVCPDDAFVESDPMLLERVLRNLIDNAIKYTERGHVLVQVLRDEEVWRVLVRDSGRGIASEDQQRIFEEFYQVGNPQRDRAIGLGLGLSIVSRLVDLLDLTLTLESAPGEGSIFSLGLAAAAVPAREALAALPGDTCAAPLPAQLQVLVLDDEAPVRDAMQALLTAHGCEVIAAASTREALVKCLIRRPDLVLADLRLCEPDDGISAIRTLRSAIPRLPALLISADTSPEQLREAHAAGLALLHKPVLEEKLLQAMRAVLGVPEATTG